MNYKWWFSCFWKWHVHLKIKLLCWLAFEKKILTWDNYLKRGGKGPNICTLCKSVEECVDHILVYCSFSKMVWREIKIWIKITKNCVRQSLFFSFQKWMKEVGN